VYFAHNGVLNIMTHNDMTDSETFFKGEIMPLVSEHGYNSRFFAFCMNGHADSARSRFALMRDGEVLTFGRFEDHKGCLYSNMRIFDYYSSYYI
jgi:hypothetical protein